MESPADHPAYLTVGELRSYLNISTSKAYELIHRKEFPVSNFGGTIRIPREPFLLWVKKNTFVPTDLTSA